MFLQYYNMERKEWIKKLKPYWSEYIKLDNEFFKKVSELEERMRKETNEKNIEFAYAKFGGGLELYFGIGFSKDGKTREPSLIHEGELEDNE